MWNPRLAKPRESACGRVRGAPVRPVEMGGGATRGYPAARGTPAAAKPGSPTP